MPQVFASDAEVNIVTLQCYDGKTQTTKTKPKREEEMSYWIRKTSGISCVNKHVLL